MHQLQVLVTHLVDSNVFIRSVVLSLDYFKRSQVHTGGLGSGPYGCFLKEISMRKDNYGFGFREDEDYGKIATFISHNTLRLLKDLMCAVRLDDINQVLFHSLAPQSNPPTRSLILAIMGA
jgi:Trpc4-associated protein